MIFFENKYRNIQFWRPRWGVNASCKKFRFKKHCDRSDYYSMATYLYEILIVYEL